MKSVFVAYAMTGENEMVVRTRMKRLHDILTERGILHYIDIFDPGTTGYVTPKQWLDHTLSKLPAYDIVLVLITSARRSEGMLIEIGAALTLGKSIIVYQHQCSVGKTYLPDFADKVYVWDTDSELVLMLEENFSRSTGQDIGANSD